MSKPPSPLLGFNNNVRHKGRVFHIQTEDSGVRHPHIITHLFMDGGRILKTTKTSYAEHLEVPGYADKVRGMMKQQHKAMFIALRDGDFDAMIAGGSSRATTQSAPEEPAEAGAETAPAAAAAAAAPAAPAPAPSPVAASPPHGFVPIAPPRAPSAFPPAAASAAPDSDSQSDLVAQRAGFDFKAIERAAQAAADDSDGHRISQPSIALSDLPPPPANVLSGTRPGTGVGGGGYRTVTKSESRRSRPPPPSSEPRIDPRVDPNSIPRADPRPSPSRTPARSERPPPTTRKSGRPAPPIQPLSAQPRPNQPLAAQSRQPGSGRYAVAQQAGPLASNKSRAPTEGRSIFGEDLISEKSLDEVILSYLAEDLEASPKK